MMKKLLVTSLLIFSVFLLQGQIILTTTSTSSAWSPDLVINSGATLKWSVSGGGVSIPETVIDDPTFDLSTNTGETTITVTSDFGFSGFTTLFIQNLEITSFDIDNATDLINFSFSTNNFSLVYLLILVPYQI